MNAPSIDSDIVHILAGGIDYCGDGNSSVEQAHYGIGLLYKAGFRIVKTDTTVVQPNWTKLEGGNGVFEVQVDFNASPAANEDKIMRHRPIAYTGDHPRDWIPGPPPR